MPRDGLRCDASELAPLVWRPLWDGARAETPLDLASGLSLVRATVLAAPGAGVLTLELHDPDGRRACRIRLPAGGGLAVGRVEAPVAGRWRLALRTDGSEGMAEVEVKVAARAIECRADPIPVLNPGARTALRIGIMNNGTGLPDVRVMARVLGTMSREETPVRRSAFSHDVFVDEDVVAVEADAEPGSIRDWGYVGGVPDQERRGTWIRVRLQGPGVLTLDGHSHQDIVAFDVERHWAQPLPFVPWSLSGGLGPGEAREGTLVLERAPERPAESDTLIVELVAEVAGEVALRRKLRLNYDVSPLSLYERWWLPLEREDERREVVFSRMNWDQYLGRNDTEVGRSLFQDARDRATASLNGPRWLERLRFLRRRMEAGRTGPPARADAPDLAERKLFWEWSAVERWTELLQSVLPDEAARAAERELLDLQSRVERAQACAVARIQEDGREVERSGAELASLVQLEEDRERRRRAWEALQRTGQAALDAGFAELVRRRNAFARRLVSPRTRKPYADFHEMALERLDLDPAFLTSLFRRIRSETEERAEALRAEQARSIGVERIEWWDASFVEQRDYAAGIDRYFPAERLRATLDQTFAAFGFDLSGILFDLAPVPRKSPHAFCFTVQAPQLRVPPWEADPVEGAVAGTDVRITANVERDGLPTYETLLHETGHGVHSQSLRGWFSIHRRSPHAAFSEAVAQLFGGLVLDPGWLRRFGATAAGDDLSQSRIAEFRRHAWKKDLFRIRLWIALVEFERRLYTEPDPDPDRVWWELMEEWLRLPRQPGLPAYGTVVHFVGHPIYYPNYILADVAAAAMRAALERRFGAFFGPRSSEAGVFLRRVALAPGNVRPWTELLREVTGAGLDPDPLIASLRGGG